MIKVLRLHAARCPALYRSPAIGLQAGAGDFFTNSQPIERWSQKEGCFFACWMNSMTLSGWVPHAVSLFLAELKSG